MPQCPSCETSIEGDDDLDFVGIDVPDSSVLGSIRAEKNFYVAACRECGGIFGAGVSGY